MTFRPSPTGRRKGGITAASSNTPERVPHISLFSGYAGFDLALKLSGIPIRTVLYVEIEPYCQQIIQQRIRDGYLDDAPIWPDVRTLDGRFFAGKVGILTAGFPCQPHSFAGKRKGKADERNLWPDTLRVIRDVAPRYVLLENVPGILANGYAGTVVGQLSEIGYDCMWDCVPAASVGAPHLRWRWWCLAYSQGTGRPSWASTGQLGGCSPVAYANNKGLEGWKLLPECASQRTAGPGGLAYAQSEQGRRVQQPGVQADARADGEEVADPLGKRLQTCGDCRDIGIQTAQSENHCSTVAGCCHRAKPSWWLTEPDVGRVAHGVASRVDRLKALGNGIVPAVVRRFLHEKKRG